MSRFHIRKVVAAGSLPLVALSIASVLTGTAGAEGVDEERARLPANHVIPVVDCSRPNATITSALTRFAHGQAVTISVSGTCRENVVVQDANVTLVTTEGATIIAADVTKPA